MSAPLSPQARAFLARERVARLATADPSGQPHLVPIVYAFDGTALYFALDPKPKRVPPERLRRVRNLLRNPRVALLVDRYTEEWSRLAFLLLEGEAHLLRKGEEHAHALSLLREKYPQYRGDYPLADDAPVVKVLPRKAVAWGALEG